MKNLVLGLLVFSSVSVSQAAPGWNPAHRLVRVQHNGVYYNRPVGWTWGGGWRWAATVEGDYMIGLGQLRLYTAQAQLVQAQAAQEWEEARWLHALVNFRIRELQTLQRTKWQLQKQAQTLDSKVKSLNTLVSGNLETWTFQAMRFFLTMPNVEPAKLADVRVEALAGAGNFRFNHPQIKVDVPIPDFSGGNVLELATFLEKNSCSVKVGSPGWVALNSLRTYLVEKGEEVLDEVVARYDSVKDGEYDAWEPISVHSALVDFEGADPKKTIH